jgi:AcrR family transcriptional regulator
VGVKRTGKNASASYVPVEARRAQLVEAAIKVMKREGVSKTTTRLVAAEVDVPLSILHYCFETKADLLRAASRALAIELIEASREAAAQATGADLRTSLQLSMRSVWSAAMRDIDAQLCTYEVITWSLREQDRSGIARDQYREYDQSVIDVLREIAQAAGVEYAHPIEALARWIFVTFDGMVLAYLVDRDERRALATMDLLVEAIAATAVSRAPAKTGRR